jgi:hypothetical protein
MLTVDHQRTLPSVLLLAAVGSACAQGADAYTEDAKQCRALEGKAWGAAEVDLKERDARLTPVARRR